MSDAASAVRLTLLQDFWKRRTKSQAYDWDTLDFEQLEPNRAEFVAHAERVNPVTGQLEPVMLLNGPIAHSQCSITLHTSVG